MFLNKFNLRIFWYNILKSFKRKENGYKKIKRIFRR
ncbi:hypothetical protein [Campylobacter phage CP81]|uniref:Uncharacterized protein n=1 Tax=Campylobacter phage CP81 TaxID=2927008 RepID=G0LWN6_9CAUD|nr:hypothetical protein FDJ37_gp061 [Campylobacter phage CP81]CBZ42228.1 hypothetical protein [Campylobacter phage CP81]